MRPKPRSGLKRTVRTMTFFDVLTICVGVGADAVLTNKDFKKYIMDDLAKLAKENKLSGLEKPKDIFMTFESPYPAKVNCIPRNQSSISAT